jgi:hypothetical protein
LDGPNLCGRFLQNKKTKPGEDFRRRGLCNGLKKVNDVIPVLLLILLGMALGGIAMMVALIVHLRGRRFWETSSPFSTSRQCFQNFLPLHVVFQHRPDSWIAVRSRSTQAVQSAFALNNPKPCTWIEGITRDQKLFISPPINGWVLVTGSGLPDADDDVDVTFRFLLDLSRKLGHVQFFSANRALGHHSWVRAEAGRVVRAYLWAGKTLWNQGVKTRAEAELGLKCFQYLETPDRVGFGQPDIISMNTEKVPLLAARWSLDPAAVDERVLEQARGVAGEPRRLY